MLLLRLRPLCTHTIRPTKSQRLTSFRNTSTITNTPTHHDLPTFLSYAQHASLSPASTVYVGTHYEYLCASTLCRLSFTLARTGGRSDAGVDLLGTWKLPCLPYPLRVLVQCKAFKAKVSPESIRELEGAAAGAPDGWRGPGTVRVLCGKRPATKGVREAVRKSGMPVVWIMVEDDERGEGRVKQVLWNERVGELGLEGMGIGLRHLVGEEERRLEEVVLLWNGVPWEPETKSKLESEREREPEQREES